MSGPDRDAAFREAQAGRRWLCCACCTGVALDDHVGHGGSIEKDSHEGPCDSPCRQDSRAALRPEGGTQ